MSSKPWFPSVFGRIFVTLLSAMFGEIHCSESHFVRRERTAMIHEQMLLNDLHMQDAVEELESIIREHFP
jgi:hypothetical protein